MGIFWGLCSVIITSVAQLSLGYAMNNLPPMLHPLRFMEVLSSANVGALTLYAGLAGYLLDYLLAPGPAPTGTEQGLRLAQSELRAGVARLNVLTWLAGNIFMAGAHRRAVHYGRSYDDFSRTQSSNARRETLMPPFFSSGGNSSQRTGC